MVSIRIYILALFLWLIGLSLYAQDNERNFPAILENIAETLPALNERVDFTVNEVPLQEFIRGIAYQTGLNVNLDSGLNEPVTNNFANVQVKDLLLFIHENYDVNITIIGNILNIKRWFRPTPPMPPAVVIEYDRESEIISIEANNAPVDRLAKEITLQTGHNIVVTPNLGSVSVNAFIRDMPFFNAMEKMAVGNNFKSNKTDDGFFIFEAIIPVFSEGENQMQPRAQGFRPSSPSYVRVAGRDSIDVKAENGDINDILIKVLEPLGISYHFLGEITEQASIDVKGVSLEKLLSDLFAGKKSTYRFKDGVLWFGAREMLNLQVFEMVQMKYRTIDSLKYIIPASLSRGVEIIEYADLNSMILAGSGDQVNELKNFLKEVDQKIPVILIEVLIIDNKNSKALSTGLTAGLGSKPTATSGTILSPTSTTQSHSLDLSLGSDAINSLIDGFNGFGWVNIGKVNANFYMTLQALEENNYIEIKSTPQLSTMNGHKAVMSIGRTEYYKEELNTLYGSVTSSSQISTTYKPVEAEFRLEIRPLVSGDREVTLQISVEQSDFTDRIDQNAPPGKESRKFQSLIRIKDQEMVLLGGLEEARKEDMTSGLPLIARVPVLKWFFSSKTKIKSKAKLNIFIKPTIIA